MTSEPAEVAISDSLALDDQLCFALYAASRSITAVYRPLLERLDLTYPQYLVMLALWEHGPVPVKRIGQLLRLDYGTLTPLLKRLEALGYLTRRRRTDDERGVEVALTGAGTALRGRAEPLPGELSRAFGLTGSQVADLQELLRALTDNTGRHLAERRN
jgi:MarR family transcriptional regulator, organic hydroperoxide resistance regulator